VHFAIGADGLVTDAAGDGFDKVVDDCVAGVIKSIQFPRPASGVMQVNYPFVFRTAGG
jgi:hypothetical protein